MRLTHNRLHRHRNLRRANRRQETTPQCPASTEELGNPIEGNQTHRTSTLMDSNSSHVSYSVKMGDDYSLDISEASSIEQISTESGPIVPEPADHQPSDEEEETGRKNQLPVVDFCYTENTPNRSNNRSEKYYRKDDDIGNPAVLPSHISYGEWKRQHLAIHSQRSPSPASSSSGSAIVRAASAVRQRRPQLTALSSKIENASPTYPRCLDPRNQDSELYQDRLPVVTPPRSVASQASFASVSSGLTARVMNTSYLSSAVGDDVLILVGDKEFRHSRAILCYASKVLAQHIDDETDELHIPHKSSSEWNELQAFLQPRSVQSASITPRNLPALLPWFEQLELTVLLRECDLLLSKLRFATAILDGEENSDYAVSNAVHELARAALGLHLARNSQQHPTLVQPCPQDVDDIILLTRISGKVCLPLTRVMCLDVLQEYLDLPHLFLQLDEKQNFQTIGSITALIDLLEDEEILDTLWPLIVSYLPEDLPLLDDRRELLKNPLFPFLLRAGLEKLWRESDDYTDAGTLLMGNGRSRKISEIEHATANAFGPDQSVEVSFLGERYLDDTAIDTLPSSNEGVGLEPMESLQYSFETWNEVPSTQAKTSNARSSTSLARNSNHMEQERVVGLDIPLEDRSLWLNTVWRKLLEPSIFSISIDEDHLEETVSRESEIRTFSC